MNSKTNVGILAIVHAFMNLGCLGTETAQCKDDLMCPRGTKCMDIWDGSVPVVHCVPQGCDDAWFDPVGDVRYIRYECPRLCGNGRIDRFLDLALETCDDGNRDDGDGCPSNCYL